MPDKLTDKEIVKALEDALYRIKGAEHLIVPKKGVDNLCNGLENALDLINRLQAENEELVNKANFLQATKNLNQAQFEELKIRLELAEVTIKVAKAEAYKEFAEGLKEYGKNTLLTNRIIDNFLKEMAGEGNANR